MSDDYDLAVMRTNHYLFGDILWLKADLNDPAQEDTYWWGYIPK